MERELAALYSGIGRPSIALQMLLRAMLLQAFYSVRMLAAQTIGAHTAAMQAYGRPTGPA